MSEMQRPLHQVVQGKRKLLAPRIGTVRCICHFLLEQQKKVGTNCGFKIRLENIIPKTYKKTGNGYAKA